MDLINRQDAIESIRECAEAAHDNHEWDMEQGYLNAIECIEEEPPAQPERKKGRWRHYEGYLTCSECRTEYDDDIMTHCCDDVPKFCPDCGADMRGENNGMD